MVTQLNNDSKISNVNQLTVVETGKNFRVYDYLFNNRYYVYCGHKCDDNLMSKVEALRIANNLQAINPVYLICGGYEGYLIADDFKALPDLSKALSVNTDFLVHKGEKVHKLMIRMPFYSGTIQYAEKI